jgi:hypothetical protein
MQSTLILFSLIYIDIQFFSVKQNINENGNKTRKKCRPQVSNLERLIDASQLVLMASNTALSPPSASRYVRYW